MTVKELTLNIKRKFGTISKFCRLSGVDRYETQKLFAASNKKMNEERQDLLQQLSKICSFTDKDGNTNKDLTPNLRKLIKAAIDEQGGVDTFVATNPEFSRTSIFQIIKGRRKFRTAKVNHLIDTLKISE